MKKLISLLSVLTITGTSLPTVVAASNYEKNVNTENLKRTERQFDPPILQDIITTINIGNINKVNKKNIIERLSNINNSIVSRPEFLNNIVFDTITINNARVHTSHNVPGFIPSSIIFTINYVAPQINLNNLIRNTNLTTSDEHRIISNSSQNIINALFQRNPDIGLTAEDLEVSNISFSTALIRSNLINYEGEVNVTFRATTYSLITWIEQLNLGNIVDNRELTININFRRLNPILSNELILHNLNLEIINITNNSAQIRIEDNYSSSPDIENPTEDNIIETGEENLIFDFDDIITVTFNAENIYLSSILQNRNLGLLQNNELRTIITRILEINPHYHQLTVNDLIIFEHRIVSDQHFGRGTINLTNNSDENLFFNFTFVIPFSNLNSNLENIDNNSHQEIARAFINANQGFNLNENDLLISNITPHSARIISFENRFGGEELIVTFSPRNINLNLISTVTDLGNIDNNSHQEIARAFINANPNNANPNYQFNLQEVEVIHPTEISATITIHNQRYIGNINVFFSTKKRKLQNTTYCDYNPIKHYYYNNLYYFFPYDYDQHHLFRSKNNNINILNKNKVYFKKENDYFQKWYRFDKDGLELKLSFQTAVAIWKFIQNHNKSEIKAYLRNLVTNVKQINNSGVGGYISNSDLDLMVDFICDGYLNFHQKLLNWSKEINTNTNSNVKNDSIFIRTWVGYQWKDLIKEYQDSAFYINEESKYNNYNNEDKLNDKVELRTSNPSNEGESNKDEKKISSSNKQQKKISQKHNVQMKKNDQNDDYVISFKVEKIDSPDKIIAKDIKNVTEKELIDSFLPKIYEEYDRINPKFKIKNFYGIKDYLTYKDVKIKNINFPIDLSSEKIISNFSIHGEFQYLIFIAIFDLEIPNLKLPAAKAN